MSNNPPYLCWIVFSIRSRKPKLLLPSRAMVEMDLPPKLKASGKCGQEMISYWRADFGSSPGEGNRVNCGGGQDCRRFRCSRSSRSERRFHAKGGHFGGERYGVGVATEGSLHGCARQTRRRLCRRRSASSTDKDSKWRARVPESIGWQCVPFPESGPPPAEILRNDVCGDFARSSSLLLLPMTWSCYLSLGFPYP